MARMLSAVAIILMRAACSAGAGDSVVLVADGAPASIIVVADGPSTAAQQGAEDLQMWIKKASGAAAPIVSESKIQEDRKVSLILVGDTKRTRSLGIDVSTFDLEEFVIRTFPGALVLIGDDERANGVELAGTQLAVDAFAEDVLGVRVLRRRRAAGRPAALVE